MIKRFFILLLAIVASVGLYAATVTWDSSTLSSLELSSEESFTKDGVTLTALSGSIEGPDWTATSKFSTSSGNFTKIEITAIVHDLTGSGWTETSPGAVWTGDANETTFGMYFENVSQIVFTIAEPAPAATEVTITKSDFPTSGSSFTKDGVTVSAVYIDGEVGDILGGGSFSTTLGNFTQIEVSANNIGSLGEGWSGSSTKKTWTGNASSVSFSEDIMGDGGEVTLKFTIADAAPATTVTWNSSNVSDLLVSGTYYSSYSKEGVTLSVNADLIDAMWTDFGDESMNGIQFHADATSGYTFSNTLGNNFTKIEMTLTGPFGWNGANLGSGWSFSGDGPVTATWTGNAATVDLMKEVSSFNGETVKSIVFYFEGDSEEPEGGSTDVIPCTAADLGKVLCTDGSIYATVSEATAASKTAAAVIAYVDTENGKALALALADDGELDWGTAKTTAAAHTPAVSGGTWTLASKDDWDNMITAAGGYNALRDGFSGVGGTNIQGWYWSSSEVDETYAWIMSLYEGDVTWSDANKSFIFNVRACLAFDIPATPAAPANSCGGGLTWELSEGVLTISYDGVGTGEMTDFGYEYDENPVNVAPWKENKSEITTVIVGDGVKSIGNYAFNDLYENFTAVTIANSVERIGLNAFMNAKWITEITLPSSLKTIDKECFAANFGFTSITIPSGVTSIGNKAFCYCTGLTSLTCEATTPPTLGSSVFYKITSKTSDMSNIPLYVPSESVAAYEAAAQWNAFDVQAIPGGGSTDVIPCTAADLGKVLCTDGSIYATVSEATAASKTAAAMIAYVDTENGKGLAIALDDEGSYDWSTANSTCEGKSAVANAAWMLPSENQWNAMFKAFGDNQYRYTDLNTAITNAGGTALMENKDYWTSSEVDETYARDVFLNLRGVADWAETPKIIYYRVRACLAFDIPAAPAYETVMNLIEAIGTVEKTAECKDKIDAARAAYNELSIEDKELVTNYPILTAAEAAYAALPKGTWTSGDCEVKIYDDKSMVVSKISGDGVMASYGSGTTVPWQSYRDAVDTLIIEEGVTVLGKYVFYGITMKGAVVIPEGVTTIRENAFISNTKMTSVYLPSTITQIAEDYNAFWNCTAVTDVYLPANPQDLTWIEDNDDFIREPLKATRCHVPADCYDAYVAKFITGVAADNQPNVTFVGDLAPITPAYEKVINLINEIPNPVVLTAECKAKIDAARAAYDALSDDDKAQVTNYETLTQAETDYANAKAAADQAEADKVVAKIAAIPTPVELKLATRDSIQNARTAYDALTADQQALVSNYQTLLDAEAALAELNKGGSASVDIVWDGNTGIENVNAGTTSPAYEGMTVTVGQGSSFSTYQSRLYFTFYSQPNGGFIFANENGTNITKVVIESTSALTSTMTEVDRMGSGWVISNENKTATWTGNTDSVSIWEGQSFTNYWVVDMITFTVNASSTPLDSAQAVKDLIDAIPTPVEYPTSGAAIEAALNAYNELSDAAKGALDDADVQKLNDAVAQYAALEAIAAIDNIPEITYDPAVKAAIETAREKYDALSDASKALVSADEVEKLTNAEQAWAALVAKVEHNVTYFGKESDELKVEKVALLRIPDPAPDLNGFEFVRWDVKAGDLLEEGLHIKAVYDPIITTNPVAYDTLVYNGTAQTLVTAGAAKEGHIEYSLNSKDNWSTELPTATIASTNVVYYKLVREGHEDYLADSIVSIIAKVPVTYTEPQAYDTLVYNAANQTLIIAGQTNDGTFEYSLNPTLLDSWKTELPKAMDAGTYNVYYRVMGDINHLDSIAAAPVAVTIAKAELTATADDKNVTYGDAVPAYTVTYEGWLGEDTITVLNGDIAFACQYAPTSNVGEYTITPSGVSAANYNITFVNGKVTVAQALLTVTAENKTVTYGDAVPAYTATYSGWKNSDNASVVSGLVYACEYAPTSNVGEYTITPSGATATNYTFAYVNGKLTVNKAALMITAEDKNVTYGDAVPTYTAAYSGWKNSDNASVVSGLVYACEYAPTSNVDEYTITPSGATATNYAISYTNGKVTVGKADLMITADDKNVIYGDAVPTYTATYSGWKNSDDASVVSGLVYACEYAPTSNVGEYTITPSGATATNYAISFTNGKVTVAKATLIVTAENKEVTYGDEAPEFTVTYSGWKNSDGASVVSGLAYTTPYIPGSSVGTYTINPNSATAQNYAITFVDGELTVVKAVVSVSGAEAQIAKFEDGNTDAVVLNNGTLNGIKLNDDIDIATTAAFSDAATGENKTITLSYELAGNASLFENYDLQPTSEIFTTDAVIIEQMNPDKSAATEEEAENKEGFEVYAYGYCDGNSYNLKYHLESGNPDQYKIEFDDSRFDDVDWTDLTVTGKEGTIDIDIPEDLPTGDYRMTITFRDSRFTWLESDPIIVSFHVNLPKAYTAVLFDNVISLVNTCNCLTDIQWYHRDSSDDIWQAIDGANGYYYRQLGGLTGEYFVSVKMNEVATYTCPQNDMETLYGDGGKIVRVNVVPNPVVDNATVTIQGSDKLTHSLSIINLMGAEMEYRTFEGDATTVEMGEYISGNYMISVDGVAVKVIKK